MKELNFTPDRDAQPEREAAFFTFTHVTGYFAGNPKAGVFFIENILNNKIYGTD